MGKDKKKAKKVQIWVKKETLEYEKELRKMQIELLKFQNHVKDKGLKVLMIFEGRDAAGKGGTIKRITEHLNPRGARVVALEKPSDRETSQWYFQRYTQYLPSSGEIVLFDYPWRESQYADLSEPLNPKIVDPVMGSVAIRNKGISSKSIAIKQGDMFVFSGGTTWHMVNKVRGTIDRVTLAVLLNLKITGSFIFGVKLNRFFFGC